MNNLENSISKILNEERFNFVDEMNKQFIVPLSKTIMLGYSLGEVEVTTRYINYEEDVTIPNTFFNRYYIGLILPVEGAQVQAKLFLDKMSDKSDRICLVFSFVWFFE